MPENTTLKVTEGINYIADGAFYEQQNVVGLSLPSSLEYIGNSAFPVIRFQNYLCHHP